MSLIIKVYPLGPLQENTYLLIDEATGEKAVIDPGYFGELSVSEIGDESSLKYLMLTHGHFDHFYAANKYLDKYQGAKFIIPEKDKLLAEKDWSMDLISDGYENPVCPKADIYVNGGDKLELGESSLEFIETPGHTAGGCCILSDGVIFTGDTLFRLSVGNTSFETGNWDDLIDSIKNKLYVLDDEITVYPGHGPYTNIGYEKRANPFV